MASNANLYEIYDSLEILNQVRARYNKFQFVDKILEDCSKDGTFDEGTIKHITSSSNDYTALHLDSDKFVQTVMKELIIRSQTAVKKFETITGASSNVVLTDSNLNLIKNDDTFMKTKLELEQTQDLYVNNLNTIINLLDTIYKTKTNDLPEICRKRLTVENLEYKLIALRNSYVNDDTNFKTVTQTRQVLPALKAIFNHIDKLENEYKSKIKELKEHS